MDRTAHSARTSIRIARSLAWLALAATLTLGGACIDSSLGPPDPTTPPGPPPPVLPPPPPPPPGAAAVRIGVIGDYGEAGTPAAEIAALVKRWEPDLVVTTGDNNYPDGERETIDDNIGQYYHEFIGNYRGKYGAGADRNRFFPALGNHDWGSEDAAPFLEYFDLPGMERYYDVEWPPVHVFVIDSDGKEPDGNSASSPQAIWLRGRLLAADEPWRLVFFHHPPYSSGSGHGSSVEMRWPFGEWGATAVLAGHDHVYERVVVDGFP